jgi:hypothetical protein
MIFNLQLVKKTFSPPYLLKRIDTLKEPTTAVLADLNSKRKEESLSYATRYLGDPELIGRHGPLDLLKTELSKLQTNTNSHIAFVGKRGVGKTALARQFLMWSSRVNRDDHIPNIFSSPKHKKRVEEHNTKANKEPQPFYHTCYIDFGRMAMTPEQFAIEYVGTFCYLTMNGFEDTASFATDKYAYSQQLPLFRNYMDLSFLLELNLPSTLQETILSIQNELEKITPDQEKLLSLAFDFPERIATATHRRIVMVLDNFEHLLSLNNYKKVNPVERLFEKHLNDCLCIILSEQEYSIREQMHAFQIETLHNLNQSETVELIKKQIHFSETSATNSRPKENDEFIRTVSPLLFHFTQGNPLFINSLVEEYMNASTTYASLCTERTFKKTIDAIKKTDECAQFVKTLSQYIPYGEDITKDEHSFFQYMLAVLTIINSLTNQEGKLHLFYQTYLEKQLETARGKTLLHSILKVLTQKEGTKLTTQQDNQKTTLEEPTRLRLSDIARQIYRSAPVTKNLLIRLMEVDLIGHANNTYFIKNRLLRRWLYLHFNYLTHTNSPLSTFAKTLFTLEHSQSTEEYNHNLFLITCLFTDCTNYLNLFL